MTLVLCLTLFLCTPAMGVVEDNYITWTIDSGGIQDEIAMFQRSPRVGYFSFINFTVITDGEAVFMLQSLESFNRYLSLFALKIRHP